MHCEMRERGSENSYMEIGHARVAYATEKGFLLGQFLLTFFADVLVLQ